MDHYKKTTFSLDGTKFAYINEKKDLLVWDTMSNNLIKCNFVCNVNTCSVIRWISMQHKYNNSKRAKRCHDSILDETLLAIGTVKGDILIYNMITKNLFLHLAGRHDGAINDMCLYKSNSLFTCSSDEHIAIWDFSTGKQISKWKADENPISSICVIDDENLLSSSTVILWWNIPEKTVLKKFSGHMTEIMKLLPVNVDSVKSYFLSAAVNDTKINAWSSNASHSEVIASFSLPLPPEDIDVSKVSSKDKPLMMSAVTKDGRLHIFEHALNGNISEFIQPKVSVEIDPECKDFSILLVKLIDDSGTCIIAYGSSKSTVAFKHVKIKELLQKRENAAISGKNEASVKFSLTSESNKAENNPLVNGLSDSVFSTYKSKLRSSMKSSCTVPELSNPIEKEVPAVSQVVNQELDLSDPISAVNALLEAIEAQNDAIIEKIFKNNEAEYMSSVVKNLPTSSLKLVLNELNRRLLQKYSITLCRWLKEILGIHLRYLTQCEDVKEILNQTNRYLSSMNISQTLHKMTVLQGLLNLHQIQNSSSDENDSSEEEPMDL